MRRTLGPRLVTLLGKVAVVQPRLGMRATVGGI